ncbi:hypothetical protein UFOVP543_36 [uncultured Caudovirales phage]|uniref:Uncharacterized protein n=1 Tax=uncultured Caudovirales phage TaxID=2100421 RepID=A0A6J5P235_9CAUD|nr:hypothetical protein UFOVP543_36 [uncultured Caudovirales phage]CAB4163378.1 hypothetical protein UFOVP804_12 [uncultured Caudovirales phage]
MANPPTPIVLKDIVLPVGWNALINDEKKTALIIGEYKYVAEAKTALTLINKPTKEELLAAIPTSYVEFYPPARNTTPEVK